MKTLCVISQSRLGYAEITNMPQVLVVYTPKVCFSLLYYMSVLGQKDVLFHILFTQSWGWWSLTQLAHHQFLWLKEGSPAGSLFIWLHQVLVAVCGILFSDQGLNLCPLHWEYGVLATGPPGKSLMVRFDVGIGWNWVEVEYSSITILDSWLHVELTQPNAWKCTL